MMTGDRLVSIQEKSREKLGFLISESRLNLVTQDGLKVNTKFKKF